MYSFAHTLIFFLVSGVAFKKRVLKSGVISFAPFWKQHHILVLEPEIKDEGIYLLDFSPLDQARSRTLLNLAFGKWVPGELRLRNIRCATNDENILDQWYNMNRGLSSDDSIYLTECTLAKMEDDEIKRFYRDIESSWKKEMNLYTHNCQHFVMLNNRS
jgi:hypothetical protein